MPRLYEPVWEKLKKDSRIIITAHPAQHRRVIKAVIKEKDSDTVFKYQCSEINLRCKLFYTASKQTHEITFRLEYFGIGDL